jgi:hypothetical protein
MKKTIPKFNILVHSFYNRSIEEYDVIPTFISEWKNKRYNFEKDLVVDKKTLKDWILKVSRYYFWAKCEWESVIGPWPYNKETFEKDLIKIDGYYQIRMNVDIITDILYKEFKLDKLKSDGK